MKLQGIDYPKMAIVCNDLAHSRLSYLLMRRCRILVQYLRTTLLFKGPCRCQPTRMSQKTLFADRNSLPENLNRVANTYGVKF